LPALPRRTAEPLNDWALGGCNSCRTRAAGPEALTFALCAAADPRQKRALAFLETIVTQPAREP
jgi:hypothetical protein